jgi:hypothetical protein
MMAKMIMVKVAPLADLALAGKCKVAKEGSTRRFHRESDGAFEVPETRYYLRKLFLGELQRIEAQDAIEAPAPVSAVDRVLEDEYEITVSTDGTVSEDEDQ